jgi:uncharacterized protein (DUF2147 family)
MFKRLTLSMMMLLSLMACAAGAHAADIRGRWLTATGNVEVEIKACPTGLCGQVARVLGNISMDGGGGAMKAPPAAIGLEVLSDLRPAGDHWQGHIFNRETGKTYDCQVKLTADGRLEVHPYLGAPIVGKTQYWTRVAGQ